jgi:hypothetical protein
MSYYSEVLLDVYSVAKTEEDKAILINTIELTLKNILDEFYSTLKALDYHRGVECFLENGSLLLYSSTVRYDRIEDTLATTLDKLEELDNIGVKVAYELIIIGEDFTDIVEQYSDNAEYRWYVSRNIAHNH